MTGLTGTLALTRFMLRLDRVRIAVWLFSIVAVISATAASVKGLYPSQASLDLAAAASQGNAAAIAFNGPAQGLNTVGGEVAFQGGALGMVLVSLMSLLISGRLTRGEEEAGRLDLLRSLAVGSHAPTASAVLVVAAMNAAVAVLTTLSLLAQHLPTAGAVSMGMSFLLLGLLFGVVAILAAQITGNTRVVYGSAGALLAAAFVVRALGDAGDGSLSWLSPIGWAQKARPFAGEMWWPFLLPVAAILALAALTSVLAARRDIGGGLVAPLSGRSGASPSLDRPIGLAVRLQRGSLIGWSVGLLAAGIAYGSLAPSVESFIKSNRALVDMMARGGGASLIDSYLATSFRVMALIATGFAVQSVARLRSEETSLRAEPVLATPVSRWRWAASHLTIAFAGSVILLAVAGLATGLSYAIAGGGMGVVPRNIGAALVYAPAMWVMAGITVWLVGLAPDGIATAWAFLAVCFVVGFLGDIIKIPHWLRDVSPFEHVPQLPAAHLDLLPLAMLTALAAVLTGVGLVGLRHRDIG